MARIQTYSGKAPSDDGSAELPGASIGRNLTYEAILEREGVERDPATGMLFRWVDEPAPSGTARRRRKHFVALSAEEARLNSKPGVCWDVYLVGVRCRHGCDRAMEGWVHRGVKFVNEHHHVTDIPRDEIWEEIAAPDPVPAEV
jgi:hypothetical protein